MNNNYAIWLLENALRDELIHYHDADTELRKISPTNRMNKATQEAFNESMNLAFERISPLEKALHILRQYESILK